jgi:hypothetical protein
MLADVPIASAGDDRQLRIAAMTHSSLDGSIAPLEIEQICLCSNNKMHFRTKNGDVLNGRWRIEGEQPQVILLYNVGFADCPQYLVGDQAETIRLIRIRPNVLIACYPLAIVVYRVESDDDFAEDDVRIRSINR